MYDNRAPSPSSTKTGSFSAPPDEIGSFRQNGSKHDDVFLVFTVQPEALLEHIIQDHLSFESLMAVGPPTYDIEACVFRQISLKPLAAAVVRVLEESEDSAHKILLSKTLSYISLSQPEAVADLGPLTPETKMFLALHPFTSVDNRDFSFAFVREAYTRMLEIDTEG